MANLPDDQAKNVEIVNTANDKSVTITTDGSKERLDVAAQIVGGTFSLSAFAPKSGPKVWSSLGDLDHLIYLQGRSFLFPQDTLRKTCRFPFRSYPHRNNLPCPNR